MLKSRVECVESRRAAQRGAELIAQQMLLAGCVDLDVVKQRAPDRAVEIEPRRGQERYDEEREYGHFRSQSSMRESEGYTKWAGWRQADQFCAATTLELLLAKHANELVFPPRLGPQLRPGNLPLVALVRADSAVLVDPAAPYGEI